MKSFLTAIKKRHKDGVYVGDEHGGAGGASGSGLPTTHASNFLFATGIECSYPTIDGGKIRRDQLAECGHYEHFKEDFRLVSELGLKYLRYGLPLHKVYLAPGKFDWSFADEAMAEIRRLGIVPILDLVHFGVPDWMGDFQNPDLPLLLSDYAEAVAKRYPWVRFYTPVNEMYVTARVSALDGIWNEQLKTPKAFVTAVKHIAASCIMMTHCLARQRNDLIMVQSESAEFTHEMKAVPSPETRLRNQLRFIALDLLYGHPPDAQVCMYLLDNGMTRAEYDWFMAGEPPGHQIVGLDYYGRNETIIKPDGSTCNAEDGLGWASIAREYYQRYRKPIMHTETNDFDPNRAPCWLWKQWANLLSLRSEGVPVLGFTWYSLIDQIDWSIELAEKKGIVDACGLYDLKRQPRPVAASYRMLLEEFGRITLVPHGEMFEITDQPARLKVEV